MDKRDMFQQVYDLYFPQIYSYFSICFNTDNADDLSQQAFTKVWKDMNRLVFIQPDDWRRWIFRIAINIKNDYLRNKYRSPQTTELLDTDKSEYLSHEDDDVLDKYIFQKAFSMLILDEKELLLLKGYGWNSTEIGRLLCLPSSTVRSRLVNAKKNLKKALDDLGVKCDE